MQFNKLTGKILVTSAIVIFGGITSAHATGVDPAANPNSGVYDPDYAEHKAWLNEIAPAVRRSSTKYNIYGSVQMAQTVLESGWGESGLSTAANNFFGIKGNGDAGSVIALTWEYNGDDQVWKYDTFQQLGITKNTTDIFGNQVTKTIVKIQPGTSAQVFARFAKYKSFASSLNYNGSLIRNGLSWGPSYYAGAWRENASTYQQAAQALQGTYATDGTYASKLINLIKNYGMADMVDELVAPTANGLATGSKTIKGLTTPNAQVVFAKLTPTGGIIGTAKTKANADGLYTIKLKDPLKKYAPVKVVVSKSGLDSKATYRLVATSALKLPTIDAVQAGARQVTGHATPHTKITLSKLNVAGQVIGTAKAITDANGTYKVQVKDAFIANMPISITSSATGYANKVKHRSVAVDRLKVPVVNPIKPGVKIVTGVATPNTKMTLSKLNAKGQVIGTATVRTNASGQYSFTVRDAFPAGMEIHIASALTGYSSKAVNVIVK